MGMRTTLLLLLVVGVLAGVLYWTDQKPPEQTQLAVPVLGGHTLDRAVAIRWELHGLAPIEVKREPGGPFRLTLPIDDIASIAHLRSIAQTYDSAQMSDQQVEDNEANRKKFGLDQPRCLLAVTFEDGSVERLELGNEGRMGNDVWVRRNGRIYAGGLALYTSLQVGLDDLRERTIFHLPPGDVTEVTIDQDFGQGRSVLHLSRTGDDWRLLSPVKGRADTVAANSLLMLLLGLRIDQFPPAVVRYPDRPADVVLTLKTTFGSESLEMWRDTGNNLFGRLADRNKISIVCGAQQFGMVLGLAADKLRARALFPLDNVHTEATTLVVEPGSGAPRIVLTRDSSEYPWSMVEPSRGAVEATPVQKLLAGVNNLRALQHYDGNADDARFGLKGEGLRIGVQAAGMKEPVFVRLGSQGREGEQEIVYAARADVLDEIVAVPKGAVDQLRAAWTDYVGLDVLDVKSPVQRLELVRRTGQKRVLQRKDDGWAADAAPPARDDTGDVVDELRSLRGKRAIGTRGQPLGDADWTLKLCRDNGDPFAVLSVWERANLPLLVQGPGRTDVAIELSPLHSDMLRKLWQ